MLAPISAFLLFSLAISHAIPLEQSKSDLGRISLKFGQPNGHPLRPMNDYSSMYMIGQVGGVGTPRRGEKPQKMAKVIFTLSSGDFWVQDSQARKALHCPYDNPVDAFSPRNSTSYATTVKEFKTHSFKGEVTGKVGKDIVKIGDGLIARNAIFGQASNFSCFFVEQTVSGVMGLGWPQIANKNLTQSPVYAALKKTRNPMFSFHINSETEEGSITFGAFNTLECQQNGWQFTPVSKPGFWQFATTGFAIGPIVHMQAQQAILLESVPFILGQIDDINRFTIELGPSAGYSELTRSVVVGCKEFKEGKLPTVTFHLGNGLDVSLAPEDYVLEDAAVEDICPTYFAYKSDFYKTNVLPGDLSGVNWILGRPLMTKYCTSFDFGQKKIGFVLAKKQN